MRHFLWINGCNLYWFHSYGLDHTHGGFSKIPHFLNTGTNEDTFFGHISISFLLHNLSLAIRFTMNRPIVYSPTRRFMAPIVSCFKFSTSSSMWLNNRVSNLSGYSKSAKSACNSSIVECFWWSASLYAPCAYDCACSANYSPIFSIIKAIELRLHYENRLPKVRQKLSVLEGAIVPHFEHFNLIKAILTKGQSLCQLTSLLGWSKKLSNGLRKSQRSLPGYPQVGGIRQTVITEFVWAQKQLLLARRTAGQVGMRCTLCCATFFSIVEFIFSSN